MLSGFSEGDLIRRPAFGSSRSSLLLPNSAMKLPALLAASSVSRPWWSTTGALLAAALPRSAWAAAYCLVRWPDLLMTDIPEHLLRFPTAAAIEALAKRFGLPNDSGMQDWEWEVADADRIDEFLAAFDAGDLSEDERFTLMETLIQSFEDLLTPLEHDPRWSRALAMLESNVALHAHSIWYWSCVGEDDPSNQWRVTPFLRSILHRHRRNLEPAP
jgi:hypothetical protein